MAEYLSVCWPSRRDVVRGIKYGLLSKVAITAIATVLFLALAELALSPDFAPKPHVVPDVITLWSVLWMWIYVVILGPLFEELFFRGFLYRGFSNTRLGITGTILITSLLFGLMHCGTGMVISNLLFGLFLGWVRWRTDSTTSSILVHDCYNSLALAIITVSILMRT
jgi:membrane protease YdiL (CAAX protease family)